MDVLSLVWLRRDLRLYDHAPLSKALSSKGQVQPVFIFDTDILARFNNPHDRRLGFIAAALEQMHKELQRQGGGLLVLHGSARAIIPKLAGVLNVAGVYAGEDYEPAARERDEAVKKASPAPCHFVKEHLLRAPHEVTRDKGAPYKVYTPYANAWRATLQSEDLAERRVEDTGRYADYAKTQQMARSAGLAVLEPAAHQMLAAVGYQFADSGEWGVAKPQDRLHDFVQDKIVHYRDMRDVMGVDGTSSLSPYLRFGLVSVRECARLAWDKPGAEKWINELIWRDFYAMILYYHPESAATELNPAYRNKLEWVHDKRLFEAFKTGQTGYPVVDAAMRQLLQTGWMHNRARMIVASFLTKDLHIDWRWGEEHFAQHLMDYDMASNVGGWQWAASTGTDAQPWFRVFNPVLQGEKFDPHGDYIRRYVSELAEVSSAYIHEPWKHPGKLTYPERIVDHAEARKRALAMFKSVA